MDLLPDGVTFNKNITYLGKTNFRNQEQVFGIKRRDRRQHMYVLGKSGTGKSVLLQNMIVQNIWNGEGVCVVDPHGELVETVLETIPPHRVNDVIYFNPADTDYHIGFNVLQIDDQRYKHLVASGLMGIFTKIWANAWSARMEYILNNAILALLDTPGSTLLGIPRLLVDKDFRQTVIGNLKDPVIKAFWVHEFETWREQYRNEAIAPIQNKVGQFLSSAIVRNVVGQAKSTIDLFEIMNSGKIFLVNVSKGRIGEDNSALLGGMLITKLQLAAMERVRIPEDERRDFYLYVDEFQNFVTDSFASILSEARKYRLNLTLAHQYIAQLVTKDSESVRDAVFGNVGTMIVFRVGATDATFLEKEMEPEFTPPDMINLPNYHIYLKLMVDGVTSRPFSAKTLPPPKITPEQKVQEQIIESSRRLYARPRDQIEREIFEWSGMQTGGGGDVNEGPGKFKITCSACGKETTVPFEPEEGRPVYCKDCVAKIKSGELKPLKGTRKRQFEPQSQSFAPLANLGIEFTSQGFDNRSLEKMSSVQTRVESNLVKGKIESSDKPKNMREQTNFRKGREDRQKIEHNGLKDILKQALGEAMEKGADFKQEIKNKETEKVEKPKEEKKTISLASLKKPDPLVSEKTSTANNNLQSKTASDEHLSALQAAIARAKIPAQNNIKTETDKNEEVRHEPVITEIKPEEKITQPVVEVQSEIKQFSEEKKQESPQAEKAEVPKEKTPEDSSVKKVKEVPEDVLRGVLE